MNDRSDGPTEPVDPLDTPEVQALLSSVEEFFAARDPSLQHWPAQFDGRSPDDDAYSRVTNPERFRIFSARAQAWSQALVAADLATVEPNIDVSQQEHADSVTGGERLVPRCIESIPITIIRRQVDDVADSVVALSAGDPAVRVGTIPACGCDACDDGSARDLELLDSWFACVVTGGFRHWVNGAAKVTEFGPSSVQWSGFGRPDFSWRMRLPIFRRPRQSAVLRRRRFQKRLAREPEWPRTPDTSGPEWTETSGASWFG